MTYVSHAIWACCAALILGGCASGGEPHPLGEKEGRTVYTQRNMWFIDGEHKTTNYRVKKKWEMNSNNEDPTQPVRSQAPRGAIRLPVNSEVTITEITAKKITLDTGERYVLSVVNVPQYSKVEIDTIYERYFASSHVDLSHFSFDERDAIQAGRIEKGMTKEAVLVARGYPPKHETHTTDKNQWRFWKSMHDTRLVHFVDGKVVRIED